MVLTYLGCVKGNPIGADISTLANTTISVRVMDGAIAQQGITVQALDPSGANFMGTTDSNGLVVFEAKLAGQWQITIPTQTNFFISTASVNVVAGTVGPTVTFTAQGQQLSLSPLTPETYGISGANITYQINYLNSGNLAEPVSLLVAGPITQTGWTANFNYNVLGSTTNSAQFNVAIPQGSYQQPTFSVEAHRVGDGSLVTSTNVRAVNRNFAIQSNYYVTKPAIGYGSGWVTLIGNFTLSTINAGDANTNWLGTMSSELLDSGTNFNTLTIFNVGCPTINMSTPDGSFNGGGYQNTNSSCGPIQQDTFLIKTGQLMSVTLVSNCGYGPNNQLAANGRFSDQYGRIKLNIKLNSAVGSISGSVTFNDSTINVPIGTVFNLTN